MTTEWIEITAEIASPLKEAVVNHLFELGAEGVDETNPAHVKGFFREGDSKALLIALNSYLSSLKELHTKESVGKVEAKSVAQENWADSYKNFFVPQKLSDRFFLRPIWVEENVVPKGLIPIHMDAGQAFGTGLHPTTQLTLRMMERWLVGMSSLGKMRGLDVGTGSGILAIAAAKLGVQEVIAIDNDTLAVEVAQENSKLNGCQNLEISAMDIADVKGEFDFIVANILLETHLLLVRDYIRLLKPSGTLIVSGLLGQQNPELDLCFEQFGLEQSGSALMQEWSALRYVNKGE